MIKLISTAFRSESVLSNASHISMDKDMFAIVRSCGNMPSRIFPGCLEKERGGPSTYNWCRYVHRRRRDVYRRFQDIGGGVVLGPPNKRRP